MRQQACQHLEQGGLARTVGPHDAAPARQRQRQRYAMQHFDISETGPDGMGANSY
ncbi:hypothetical protein LP415_16255 [Polaromonas sp. P1(28)-8]|nr:hypothetical protein LP415_16255 [Polaromonas sp. P1(28)-8]